MISFGVILEHTLLFRLCGFGYLKTRSLENAINYASTVIIVPFTTESL